MNNKVEYLFNAQNYGVIGDGVTDATIAIQKVMDDVGSKNGGIIYLPPGKYLINGNLKIPAGITLQGVWSTPHHSDKVIGTMLLATNGKDKESGDPLIFLNPSSAVKGITIYYPEQKYLKIHPYPWTIQGQGMHCNVEDVTLVNSYNGIDFGTYHNELHFIRNVFGCCLRRGVFIDKCTDIGRIENVHFNSHYWFRTLLSGGKENVNKKEREGLINYLDNNLEAFIFGRTDWEYVLNTFAWRFKICYKFIQTKDGACNGNFLGIGADAGQYCVYAEASQRPGILITNGEFVSFSGETPTEIVTTESFNGVLQLNNCSFWGRTYQLASIKGDGYVSFNQCNFLDWGFNNPNVYGIQVKSGDINITNCRFAKDFAHIHLGQNVRTAVITGNNFRNNIQILNDSSNDIQIGYNVFNKPKK